MLHEGIMNSLLLPEGDLTTYCGYCPIFFIRMMIALIINIIWIFLIAFGPFNVGIMFGEQNPFKYT